MSTALATPAQPVRSLHLGPAHLVAKSDFEAVRLAPKDPPAKHAESTGAKSPVACEAGEPPSSSSCQQQGLVPGTWELALLRKAGGSEE